MGFYLNKFKHLTNKQEMNTAATVLFVFTMICAWSAFGLGVSSVGAKTWIYKNSTFDGLWQSCVSAADCTNIAGDATLNACRAFVIMGIAITFIGTVLYQSRGTTKISCRLPLKEVAARLFLQFLLDFFLFFSGCWCFFLSLCCWFFSCVSCCFFRLCFFGLCYFLFFFSLWCLSHTVREETRVDSWVWLTLTSGWVMTEETGTLTLVVANCVNTLFIHSQADSSAGTFVNILADERCSHNSSSDTFETVTVGWPVTTSTQWAALPWFARVRSFVVSTVFANGAQVGLLNTFVDI